MADSIHVARWIDQFENRNIEFVLFPSGPNRRIHPRIEARLSEPSNSLRVSLVDGMRYASFPLGLADLALDHRTKAPILRRVLSREQFDFIHVLEFQHAGYLLLRALAGGDPPAPVIATNWGSDVYWFMRFPAHREKIERLLALASRYSSECERDRRLAVELGFRGEFLPTNPNAGGIPTERYRHRAEASPPSQRRRIAVKGYDRFVGLAPVALAAIEEFADVLREYEIVFYSAGRGMRRKIRRAAARTGLSITGFSPYALSHDQMMELFLDSRIYLGVSESDGISTSLLEAMTTGCFPLQTSTSCADEWIQDGISGMVINGTDETSVVEALIPALSDDDLVDRAMGLNLQLAASRLDSERIRRDSLKFYKSDA